MGWGSFFGGMVLQGIVDSFRIEREKEKAVKEHIEKQEIINLKQEVERLKNQITKQ